MVRSQRRLILSGANIGFVHEASHQETSTTKIWHYFSLSKFSNLQIYEVLILAPVGWSFGGLHWIAFRLLCNLSQKRNTCGPTAFSKSWHLSFVKWLDLNISIRPAAWLVAMSCIHQT